MDTDALRTFVEVTATESITVAARALGYTQSGVSRQIAGLEQALGARLFDRVPRGVRLTEQGRAVLPHVEASLARLDLARRELDQIERLEDGHVRVGAFPTAAAALVPRAMTLFRAGHPNVSLSLVEGATRRQLGRLHDGDVDVAVISAFGGRRPDRASFDVVRLLEDRLLIAVPRGHRLADRRRVRLAELADENWIGAGATDDDGILGPARLPGTADRSVAFAVKEWTAKLGLVAAGLGITLVPSLAVDATRSDVRLLALGRGEAPPRDVYAATLRGATPSPAARAFIDALRESALSRSPGHERARPPT